MENVLQDIGSRWKVKKINQKKIDYLNSIYEKNPTTGNYVIQVALDKYNDVFNDWDNSPFKKRDMDPDLALFLENCFDEIPQTHGVDICFYLPKESKDTKREEVLMSGIKTYYSFYVGQAKRALKGKYQKTLEYILTSFTLLAVSVFLASISGSNIILGTVQQGFNVGGWVFLWEAISMICFRRRGELSEMNKYERFLKSSIYFKYDTDSNIAV